jgi:predicted patatin/cPLA2 family phospholipase
LRTLVVEGGGMRGAYAGGVLVGLTNAGERFDAVYASSSGACSAAYLAAQQPEGIRIWEDYLHGNRLLSVANVLRGRPYLDLDYLVDDVFGHHLPLDLARLRASTSPLWVTLTDAETGLVEYRDLRREAEPLRAIRATAALPIAYPRPVEIEGRCFFDGGIGDPIPLRRAIEEGAQDITVVLTNALGYRHRPMASWAARLGSRPYPGAIDAFRTRHERYNDALDLVAHPPSGVTIRAIAPPPALHLSRSARRLRAAVAQGLADAARVGAPRAGAV